jgi:DNA-binding transcriptional ArsR family regulator
VCPFAAAEETCFPDDRPAAAAVPPSPGEQRIRTHQAKVPPMRAKPEYRDRDDEQVAVLDALVDRGREGMTVFEIRSRADVDIDDLESALSELKAAGLIEVEHVDERTIFKPDERVIPEPGEPDEDESFVEWLRDRLPF